MIDLNLKILHIFYNIDGLYQFTMSISASSYAKRVALRMFFIYIDSLILLFKQYKNAEFNNKTITSAQKKEIDEAIRSLEADWKDKYDIIRDKISAHQQEIGLVVATGWWNEIDYSTVGYIYELACDVRSLLLQYAGIVTFFPVDYEEIDFTGTSVGDCDDGSFYLSNDRFALVKKNTAGIVPCDSFQLKCSTVLGIVNMAFVLCAVTLKTENYKSHYRKILFDNSWLLMICDLCSLLENLYDGSKYDKSLLVLSPEDWKGLSILNANNIGRDNLLEEEIRKVRNKVAAHIDIDMRYINLTSLFESLNLSGVHKYFFKHANVFKQACEADIRTKGFAIRDTPLDRDVVGVSYSGYKPF